MRQIRVVYRAVFQQLKSVAMICRAPVNVEVAQLGNGVWISRSPDTGVSFRFTECQSAEAARWEAEDRFVEMLSDGWWMLGKPPDGSLLRPLEPEEYTMKDGKVYWYELNDFTHIMDPKRKLTEVGSVIDKAKIWPAACGESPSVKRIISLKADIEPSCPKCAEVYRERYAKK